MADAEAAERAAKRPRVAHTQAEWDDERRVIVVVEGATLEVVKAGKSYQLLNCDDHKHIIKKLGKDIADCRPVGTLLLRPILSSFSAL